LYLLNACRGWFDTSFEGGVKHHRVVNHVLGNLLHLHWPGAVTHPISGEDVACINWDMFATSSIVDIRMPRELFGMSFG
jgi:hypothetical protein